MLLFDHFKSLNYAKDSTGIVNVRFNKLLAEPQKKLRQKSYIIPINLEITIKVIQ